MRAVERSKRRATIPSGRALTVGGAGRDAIMVAGDSAPRDHDRAPSIGDELRALVGALWRRKHWIALTALLSLLGGLAYLAIAPPRYLATAQILIDPRSKRVVEGAVVQGGFGSSAVGADTLLIDSQVELVLSNAILSRVITELGLAKDPEFILTRGEGIRIKLRNWLGRYKGEYTPEKAPVTDPAENAVYRLRDKHLTVRRVGNTYVINVSVFSELPDKAARIANAIAAAYVRDQVTAAGDTTRATTALLQARIAELRNRVEVAERAVEDYRTKNGLIGTSGGLVNEQQLQSLNEKLSVARTATALAKARYDIVKGVTPSSDVLAAQSEALRSPVIQSLRQNLARLDRRVAVLNQTLGPRHPDFAGIEGERRSVQALIGAELTRIRTNAQSEYDLALANERALDTEFKGMQARASTDNQSGVKLRELQREGQSARQVYEAFLTRVKETREQEDLSREQSRIIGDATVPSFASSPPTALVLIGSLGGGIGLGSMLAWLAHILERPPVRDETDDDTDDAGDAPSADAPTDDVTGDTASATAPAYRPVGTPREDNAEGVGQRLAPSASGRGTVRADRAYGSAGPMATAVTASHPSRSQSLGASRAAAVADPDQRPVTLKLPSLAVAGPGGTHLTLGAGQLVTFADHIAAVDTDGFERDEAYTEAIERILADARRSSDGRSPAVVAITGIENGAGTSSAALALAYRSAMLGQRTMLIDASFATAELSLIFASEHVASRVEDIHATAQLRALLVRDARSGLALLPLAACEPDRLSDDAALALVDLTRALFSEFDLVVIDAGNGLGDAITPALLRFATRVLIACPEYDLDADMARTAIHALGSAARKARILATLSRRPGARRLRADAAPELRAT